MSDLESKPQTVFKTGNAFSDLQMKAFIQFRETGKMSLNYAIPLALYALLTDIPFWILQKWPGAIGMKLRQIYYGRKFSKMGSNVLIESDVDITNPNNIEVSDYAFIDKHVVINALSGKFTIGRRIHIAQYAMLSGAADIYLGDYVGISGFAKIYSHSERPAFGKRMSGPMIPESMKGMITAPVRIEKDAFIGAGAIVLPGVIVGEGAVIAANSLVLSGANIPPYTIWMGIPAVEVGRRRKVTVPDI